jgi:hypothetical protein
MTDRNTPTSQADPEPEPEPTITIVGRSTPKFEKAMADFERWQAETERAQRRNQARWQEQQHDQH